MEYSEDPKQHLKWQIEAIEDNIILAQNSNTEEPHKTNYINELKREIEVLKSK